MRSTKPALGFILLTLFLDVLGFGLLIPVAPKLVQGLLHPAQVVTQGTGAGAATKVGDLAASLHSLTEQMDPQTARVVGLLAATYAIMQFIFAPILGAWSDQIGRRPVLLISLFGSGLDYFALALAPNLTILFITRAINGLTGGSMTAASAYIADITTPDKRAAAFGMIGAAFGMGFIMGPLMGGWLGSYDIHYPFYAAGTLSLLNWLYGLFLVPESLAPENRSKFKLSKANPIGALKNLNRYPLVAGMAASLFLLNIAMFGLHTTWTVYTMHRYHWEPWQVGLSLALVGVGAAVVQAGLARKLIPALGERRSLLFGLVLAIFAYIGYGTATQGWMIYAIVLVASIGGIAQPAGQSMITRSVRPDEQGAIQGAITSLQSIAAVIGPLIGSNAFAYFISDRAPAYIPGASFYVGAFLATIGTLIAARATRGSTSAAAAVVTKAP